MNENKKGGKRLGAGRKPIGEKKRAIFLYVENSATYKFGSEEKMKKSLYDFIKEFNSPQIKDLNKPTNEIKPQEPPTANYAVNISTQPTIQILNQEQAYIQELKDAKTVSEIKRIIISAKNDPFLAFAAKLRIEKYGQELSKNMYTD
jgi:hypothetical protein